MSPCLSCARPYDPDRFPLGRPRIDGSRHPFRYCDECLSQRVSSGMRRESRRRANRESMRRVRTLRAAPHTCEAPCPVMTPRPLCYFHARRAVQ